MLHFILLAPFLVEAESWGGRLLAIILILVGGWLLLDAARHPKLQG